jgi:hypothetical protein
VIDVEMTRRKARAVEAYMSTLLRAFFAAGINEAQAAWRSCARFRSPA